jgi:hypothetical protein
VRYCLINISLGSVLLTDSVTQELANTWGSATNQATDIISKQMMNNVSSYMNQAQKVANSMSTQASKAASSSSK